MGETNEFYVIFGKAVGFFVMGVTLASIFVWCLVQGWITHFGGDPKTALVYYFISWFAGVGGLALYIQAKYLFHYAKISR